MFRRLIAMAVLAAVPASAQLLPQVPTLPGRVLDTVSGGLDATVGQVRTLTPRALEAARLDRIAALVRGSGGRIALDDRGAPAVSGEVVLTDPTDAQVAALEAGGFRVLAREGIEGLGVGYVRMAVPKGVKLDRALVQARAVVPDAAADVLHFQSGAVGVGAGGGPVAIDAGGITVGIIDGGVGSGVRGQVRQAGFANGAPRASDHGTAVASLIAGGGAVKGAAPGASVVAADVYGSDRAGGNAVAVARAIGWLARERVGVVSISLVGPSNPLVARTVAAAQARGMRIVAAVGNDGPAAPPAYPASYPGVIAVTGVDGRGRVLLEAGKATHLDFAAPGADMVALDAKGRAVRVRGTSYAAPLVAAMLARAGGDVAKVAVRDAGKAGYGRGLVCRDCVGWR